MIAIIDYEAGNLTSVARALRHIGVECRITKQRDEILASERVIFPGVGAAGEAMEIIRREGIDRVIRETIGQGKPFLGICLGAQIILGESEEDNGTPCRIWGGTIYPLYAPIPSSRGWTRGRNSISFIHTTPHLKDRKIS